MHRLFLAAILAAFPVVAGAATTMVPSTLANNPAMYDGQTVTVAGTVSDFHSRNTAMGQFSGFQLCDSRCIMVIDKTNQSRSNGSTATVTGVFHASFKGPKKTWTNALLIQ